VQDLSNFLPGDPITALAPTSQAGGNMMSSNKLAHTAPGSPPVDPLPPTSDQGDPKIGAIDHKRTVLTPDAAPETGNPYPKGSGPPRWVRAGGVTTDGLNDYAGGLDHG
jgi:hypothetical protein